MSWQHLNVGMKEISENESGRKEDHKLCEVSEEPGGSRILSRGKGRHAQDETIEIGRELIIDAHERNTLVTDARPREFQADDYCLCVGNKVGGLV